MSGIHVLSIEDDLVVVSSSGSESSIISMELVVAVAIGVLLIIFIGSLLALLFLCRHRRAQRAQEMLWHQDNKPMLRYSRDTALDGSPTAGVLDSSDMDDMLQLSPNIAKILNDNDWIYDASGLVHHSLAILRICHQITDQLSGLTFNPVHTNQDAVDEVRDWTRRIMPRVDDLVRTMYLCSRRGVPATLLEARAAALVMAVGGVSTAFRAAYRRTPSAVNIEQLQWLRTAVPDMETHLDALRLAAEHEENSQREKVDVIMRSNNGNQQQQSTSGTTTTPNNDAATTATTSGAGPSTSTTPGTPQRHNSNSMIHEPEPDSDSSAMGVPPTPTPSAEPPDPHASTPLISQATTADVDKHSGPTAVTT